MIAALEARNQMELFRWSRDGGRLYYEAEGNVYALDSASGAISNVTNFDPQKSRKTHLRLSPDEQWLTYAEPVEGVAHIWVMRLMGGAPTQVTQEGDDNRTPQWLPDGQRIVYGSRRNGVYQICVAYRDGRTPVQLTFGHENLLPWFPSPDGRRILYVSGQKDADLFRRDLKTGVETPVNRGTLMELSPTFAPDGQTVAFQQTDSTENLALSTLLATSNGTDEAPLRLATEASDPRWSPQTERVAFLRQAERLWSLWTVRSDGADQQIVVKENVVPSGYNIMPFNWAQQQNYSWSPDGSRLAYISAQSGALNVWTIGGDGQGGTMVSDNADLAVKLFCPIWSPDGRRIAYLTQKKSASGVSRSVLISEDGKNRAIFETPGQVRMLGWSETGGEFLIGLVENPNTGQVADAKLLRLSLAGGAAVVTQFSSIYPDTLCLAPDRRRVAFVMRPREPQGNDELRVAEVKGGQPRKVLVSADPNVYLSGLVWSPEANSLCFIKQSRTTAIWAIENFR
jgi:TolB protein